MQYTATELVRLELLAYENPEGLHPIEQQWRDLCRKLISHIKEDESVIVALREKVSLSYMKPEIKDWKPFNFPGVFKPTI